MKSTTPRPRFRSSRTSAAILLALFTFVSPLSPLFAAAAQAQGGRLRPVSDGRAAQPADKGARQGGEGGSKAPDPAAAQVVAAADLEVTLDDGLGVGQSKRPGETITYTVVIRNTHATDAATNVKFLNDLTANANLTFVNGSVQTQPIARADAFNVLGNVRIDVPAASGLLANDFDPDTGGSTGLTITTAPTTSALGGDVAINTATGAFTYNPPAGYDGTGADSFSYTVTDATGKTDTATATFAITGMIWFVNNAAASCTSRAAGCGRLTNPFSDLASFNTANTGTATNNGDQVDPEVGDNIFIYTGNSPGTPYTGPLTLRNDQKLIGQGASDTLLTISGVTLPPHSNALPTTNEPAGTNPTPPTITSAANGVNLAQNNVLRGFNVGNVGNANRKINGAGFGQLTVGKTGVGEADVSLSGTGMALFLQNGTIGANSSFNSAASTGSTAQGILLTQITAGTLNFAGVTIAGSTGNGIEVNGSQADVNFGNTDVSAGTNGVVLANNSAGTRSFGTLTITGGTGVGFSHLDPDGAGALVGGGAVSVAGAMNVINPAGNGIDIQNSNANLSFAATTVSKGSTGNIGVNLVNNATRTIAFTQLSSTTTNAFALLTNNSGTVTAGGGSLTQNGAGGGAASFTNTALGLTFNAVSSTNGGNGLLFNTVTGTFTTASATLANIAGAAISMTNSSVAANFGNTAVNGAAGAGVFLSSQSGNVTFGSLNLSPNTGNRGIDASNTSGVITSTSGNISTTNASAIFINGPAGRTPLAMVLTNVDVTYSANSVAQGVFLNLVSGNLTVNDPGTATSVTGAATTTGSGVEVTNSGAGTINFGNTSITGTGNGNGDDAGTGVVLTTNAGAITFGALTVTPDSGERGLLATDGDDTAAGAITVASGTITTTNDTAVEITGRSATIRTPLNIQLTAVNTAGGDTAANGIRLANTSAVNSPGGFRVLGTGGTCTNANTTGCTGGTINDTAGADSATAPAGSGIHLQNVDSVSFTRMLVRDHANYGVRGSNVNGFTLSTSVVRVNGTTGAGPFREGSVSFDGADFGGIGLVGSSAITNSDIRQGFFDNLRIDNDSGTMNLTITGSTFRDTNAAVGNDNISIEVSNAATGIVSVTGSTFASTGGDHFNFVLANTATGHVTFTGNTLSGGHAIGLGQGIFLIGANWNGTARYNISGNTMTGTRQGHAIHTNKGSGTGAMQGTISGNTIGDPAIAESGASESSGIQVGSRGAGGSHIALVSGNTIRQYDERAISIEAGEDGGAEDNNSGAATSGPAASLDVTVTGNSAVATATTPNALHGIELNFGNLAGDNNNICADVGGAGVLANSFANAGGDGTGGTPANGGSDIRMRQRNATQVRLPGYGGSAFDSAAVIAYLSGRNVTTTVTAQTNDAPGRANDGYAGGAACTQPAAPTIPSLPSAFSTKDTSAGESAAAQQQQQSSLPTVIPGLMITRQPQAAGRVEVPAATQTAPATAQQPAAQPKAASEKSAAAEGSKGGDEKSKKDGTKGGVSQPRAGSFEVTIGTLPAQDQVTITFQVTIAPTLTPAAANSVSNQGTLTADGGISKLSDDPTVGGANDPTVTPIDKFEPAIDVVSSDTTTDQGDSVTFTATLGLGTAPGVPAPTGTVNFVDQTDANPANWETLCANVAITGATAACATTAVDAGTRTIAAVYSGDGRYDPATDTVTQTVTACLANPVVTSTADDGSAGTLRHAITNACVGTTITFDITGAGPHTIALNPSNGELAIAKNLTINGPTGESVAVTGGTVRAFHVTAGTVSISNLTVRDSDPTAQSGGGLFVENAASVVTLRGMTFSGNSAQGATGGAIAVSADATLTIINSTISGNAANSGGAIENGLAVLNLVNVTMTNNDANNGDTGTPGAGAGGGILNNSGTTNVRNSIITGNLGATTTADVSGAITDQGNNLIGVAAGISPTLASNGGPTQTHALLAGSAALDAGNNCVLTAGTCAPGDPAVTTDQRGFDRAADAADADTTDTVDIGAFEAQASVQTFADASIAQDSSHTVTDFNVGDADSTLTVTATSDNTALVPNAPANLAISAGSSASQRTLVVTPAAGQTGTANITVTVTDTVSGTSMSDTFLLTVAALETPVVTITADNPDPSLTGQAVTVTYTVTGSAGTPTGNVVITASGGGETCMASVATGQCDITLTAAGNRTLTATYSGDSTYAGGTDTEAHAVLPSVTISDATASEASQLATFTVHLSSPSTETVTVNFETADEPAGPGKAVAGQDYTSTSGSVVFQPGQTLETISVLVNSNGGVVNDPAGEPNETFLVNLTSATNGNVVTAPPADNQATGTITEVNNAGAILISEIRTSGPGGSGDQFVEIYNNSDSEVTLQATDASAGYALVASNNGCAADPVVVGIIANGTTIPARGHYLFAGSAYSLTSAAALNLTLAADLNPDVNVALFSTSNLASFSSATRLDAVGFFDGVNGLGGNCDLLREGTLLNAAQGSTSQYSFFRKLSSGKPQDTGRSVDDFTVVSTTPSVAVGFNATPALGAPGPENIASPIQRNDKIKATLIDPMQSNGDAPNSVRKMCADPAEECDPSRSQFGTFSIRRRWTNTTGENVTSLRFRLVNVTTGPTPAAGTADLRAISSGEVTGVTLTGGGTVTVEGTTLDAPTQALGGGFNSTLSAGTVTLGDPLAPGASINLQFLLGVQQPGAYNFFVNVEAGPPPSGVLMTSRQAAPPAKKEGVNKNTQGGRQ